MDDSPLFSPSTEKEIFLQALEIEDDEKRDAFLAKTCQGDEKLIERIRSLLGASESTGHFLDAEEFPAAKEELDVLAQDIEEESRFMEDLGTTIRRLGDYELIEELGRGAAGVVYRARQTSLNREVAIKVILGSSWTSAAGRRRFRAEAEAAASLNHRHIVPVYEINHAEGHDFYSMAYVRGGTLGDHLSLIHQDHRKAVTLMAKVARTVQVAHDHGILHRDLKPDNILLGEDGEPLISDFGLAFDLRRSDGLTLTGQILGTPQYMAPEQAWTHLGGITAQTDIYGLGAILFHLLSGRPVIEADNVMGAIQTLISEPALRLRSIDPGIHSDLETIVAKCLEKTPTDRYASARSLAEDLEAWLDRRSIAARAQTPTQRFFKWIQRKPVHAGLLASILLLLLSFGIGGPLFALRQASLREIAESAKAEALEAAELANRQANANRRLAYASNMRLINMAARFGTTPKMATQTMLKGLRPRDGGDDFRDWEWYYVYGKLHSAPIHIKHKPKGPINSLDFSPFGESLLVSSPKGTEVFDSVNRVMGRKFIDGEEHLFSAWNPDGRSILTLGKSGKVKLWN
ncbi:MAG: WD40 repeat domain-containing serine/threonine protein kinase, partial [Verrucomicrobiota bacterium]